MRRINLAVCGGIRVEEEGSLHSIVEIDAEEPLPTIGLSLYRWQGESGRSKKEWLN